MRRLVDLAASCAGLFCLAPALALIGLAVRLDAPGPFLFRQKRIGRGGSPFTIFKFRTMRHAPADGTGPEVTAGSDNRITRTGRVLRRYKLDELPQLWNVLIGQMSLVGPRPEVPRYVDLYTPDQRRVLDVRPGLTGRASIEYLDEEQLLDAADDPERCYREIVLPAKLRASLKDVSNRSLREYFSVLGQTLTRIVFRGEGRSTADHCSSEWMLNETIPLRGYSVEWASSEYQLISTRNQLYRIGSPGDSPALVATFPAPTWKTIASWLRPLQRLLRFSYYNVQPLPDGRLFATFDRGVGVQEGDRFVPLTGLRRPTRVLRGSCAVTPDGCVYFGEYLPNTERGPVHVYEFNPENDKLRVVHTFAAGQVRHVHGVYLDDHNGDLICVTGDLPSECRVLRTSDRFSTLETLGAGDESWRSVAFVTTEGSLWYGTDAQYAPNKLFRIDRSTGLRHEVADLPGPVYGAKKTEHGLFFAVAAELCPSQTDHHASLWRVDEQGIACLVASFEKDRLPNRYFQHGTINFALGEGSPVFHTIGLKHADHRVFESRQAA